MRVEIEVTIPNHDSYGRDTFYSYVAPYVDECKAVDIALEYIAERQGYKSGTEIKIKFGEDWYDERSV